MRPRRPAIIPLPPPTHRTGGVALPHPTMRPPRTPSPRLTSDRAARAGAALMLVALAALVPAQAERPLVSETADSPASGECQVEVAILRTASSGQTRMHGQQAYASCGTPWDGQLGLLVAREHGGGEPRSTLLGLHGKSTLVTPEDGLTGWGIAYGLTSDHLSGEGWQHGSTHLTLVATRRLGPGLLGHLNLGWQRAQRDHSSSTAWSMGIESDGATWGWAMDLFGDDVSRPWVSGGLLLAPNERLAFSLNLARQLDSQRAIQWTLGGRLKF